MKNSKQASVTRGMSRLLLLLGGVRGVRGVVAAGTEISNFVLRLAAGSAPT